MMFFSSLLLSSLSSLKLRSTTKNLHLQTVKLILLHRNSKLQLDPRVYRVQCTTESPEVSSRLQNLDARVCSLEIVLRIGRTKMIWNWFSVLHSNSASSERKVARFFALETEQLFIKHRISF